jgi:cell division septation protein DedD
LASPSGSRYDTIVAVSSDPGIRNLDQLQEEEEGRRMPQGVAVTLVVLGGACVLVAAGALGGRTSQTHEPKADPLGELVSHRAPPSGAASARPADLSPRDVTFPQMLSDDGRPTTALAAVRAASSVSSALAPSAPSAPAQPPPATDRLPVVPLPAESLLEATPIVSRPRDALTKAASDAAQITTPPGSADAAPPGHEGGYQLQVSSFHTQTEAESFAEQLRARGHKAYVVEARVPGRGTWYRVRIGPFQTQHSATQYRSTFEEREHVVPFIVPPETTAKAH